MVKDFEDFEIPPDLVSKTDQANANSRALGEKYGTFYEALVEKSIPENVAAHILLTYIRTNSIPNGTK